MAEHHFVDNICRYCGATYNPSGDDQRTCYTKADREAAPRPVPESVFASVDPIYERIQELRREKDAALASTTSVE